VCRDRRRVPGSAEPAAARSRPSAAPPRGLEARDTQAQSRTAPRSPTCRSLQRLRASSRLASASPTAPRAKNVPAHLLLDPGLAPRPTADLSLPRHPGSPYRAPRPRCGPRRAVALARRPLAGGRQLRRRRTQDPGPGLSRDLHSSPARGDCWPSWWRPWAGPSARPRHYRPNTSPPGHRPGLPRAAWRADPGLHCGPSARRAGTDASLDGLESAIHERTPKPSFFIEELTFPASSAESAISSGKRGAYRLARPIDDAGVARCRGQAILAGSISTASGRGELACAADRFGDRAVSACATVGVAAAAAGSRAEQARRHCGADRRRLPSYYCRALRRSGTPSAFRPRLTRRGERSGSASASQLAEQPGATPTGGMSPRRDCGTRELSGSTSSRAGSPTTSSWAARPAIRALVRPPRRPAPATAARASDGAVAAGDRAHRPGFDEDDESGLHLWLFSRMRGSRNTPGRLGIVAVGPSRDRGEEAGANARARTQDSNSLTPWLKAADDRATCPGVAWRTHDQLGLWRSRRVARSSPTAPASRAGVAVRAVLVRPTRDVCAPATSTGSIRRGRDRRD